MPYDLAKLPTQTMLRPIADAGIALARHDERIARSPVGAGLRERMHFVDACASLWIEGELVHLEDLVLHDATRYVLKTRRRIPSQGPAGHSAAKVAVRGQAPPGASAGAGSAAKSKGATADIKMVGGGDDGDDGTSPFDAGSAVIDANILAFSSQYN